MTKHTWLRAALWATLPLHLACGSAEPEPAGGEIASESGACIGTFSFAPSEPVVGKNQLEAALRDRDDNALVGASLDVTTWMPAHGHGTSATAWVTELGGGSYRVDNLVFEMPGSWEVTIDVEAGAIVDRFVLPVSVR